jgi:DMSO reductase family type II enzyme chaperone
MCARPATPTPSDDETTRPSSRRSPNASDRREADLALCRSAVYEALALGLRPPTDETLRRLVSPEGSGALADAAAVLDAAWDSALAPRIRRLARPVTRDDLRQRFERLFGHTARGGVPPYETEYGADSLFQPMHEMSDLGAFYRAFGLRLAAGSHERPDHASCECEFLAFLCRKEAWALDRGDAAMHAATAAAARRFLRDHLGRWGPALGRALARRDGDGVFGELGLLAAEFLSRECARVGVPAGPEFLPLRSATLPEIPAACGAGDAEPAACGPLADAACP